MLTSETEQCPQPATRWRPGVGARGEEVVRDVAEARPRRTGPCDDECRVGLESHNH
jgi:hypothetical protein